MGGGSGAAVAGGAGGMRLGAAAATRRVRAPRAVRTGSDSDGTRIRIGREYDLDLDPLEGGRRAALPSLSRIYSEIGRL